MDIIQLVAAADAIYSREVFCKEFGRQDIDIFSDLARDVALGRIKLSDVSRHPDWAVWDERVRRQIKVETAFPVGTRLSSFRYSPVIFLSHKLGGQHSYVPTTEVEILEWLRDRTWIQSGSDVDVMKATGVSLPEIAKILSQLFVNRPKLFFMILCDEALLVARASSPPMYPARPYKAGQKCWRFHDDQPLADVMDLLFEWRRVVLLADYCFNYREFNHVRFRDVFVTRRTINFPKLHSAQTALFDAHLLSVPSLRVRMDGGPPSSQLGLQELNRVVKPDAQSGGKTLEPLYHFYGLDYLDIALIGLLEIVAYARGIRSIDGANARLFNRKQARLWFSEDSLQKLIQGVFARWWPTRDPKLRERALKAYVQRHLYARKSRARGSSFRFDPGMCREPTRDAVLFRRLATKSANVHSAATFGGIVGFIRDSLCASFSTPISPENVLEASVVVAHLMTAATPLTRDPTLRQFAHHYLWASGYTKKRDKVSRSKPIPADSFGSAAGRFFCCVVPKCGSASRVPPMLPIKGYSYPDGAVK